MSEATPGMAYRICRSACGPRLGRALALLGLAPALPIATSCGCCVPVQSPSNHTRQQQAPRHDHSPPRARDGGLPSQPCFACIHRRCMHLTPS